MGSSGGSPQENFPQVRSRFAALDLLRFFAALSVVLYHFVSFFTRSHPKGVAALDFLEQGTRFGFLGVPLFFMISGFVIFASARNRGALEFAIARAARLYPVYWLGVGLTALIVVGSGANRIGLRVFLANLTMLQSYLGSPDIDGVYWTLAKELQFYFLFFVLISVGQLRRDKVWLAVWLACTATFAFTGQPFFMGWIITPEFSSLFIAGICFYRIAEGGVTPFYGVCVLVSMAISAVEAGRYAPDFIPHAGARDRWISMALVCAFHAVFLAVALGRFRLATRGALGALGTMTYPLYLIHAVNGRILMGAIEPRIGPQWAILLTLGLALLSAWLISRYYEGRVATPLKAWLLRGLGAFSGAWSRI